MTYTERAPDVLWRPSTAAVEQSAMARYVAWPGHNHGVQASGCEDLWSWSVEHLDEFWASVWEFFDVRASQPYHAVLTERGMPGATWFPGARLNYAEQTFRHAMDERPALVVVAEGREPYDVSWAELRRQVGALTQRLREWGVRPGDRVAAYLPNIPEAVVALLATASVGAVWSRGAPEYGTQSVIDRFAQIAPTVLVVTDGYRNGGREVDRTREAAEIASALPSVRCVLAVPCLRPDGSQPADAVSWPDAVAGDAEPAFPSSGSSKASHWNELSTPMSWTTRGSSATTRSSATGSPCPRRRRDV
jgi:acetoacetyl-CoA synthetase